MDLNFPQAHPTLDEYLEMIRLKTGALMGLTCEVGALVAGKSPAVLRAARGFGQALGVAFQLQDDVLGVWGDEAEMGKTANDLDERKWGLPVVLAMQEVPRVATLLATPPEDHAATAEIRALLEGFGIREKAQSMASEAAQKAASYGAEMGLAERIMELVDFAAHRVA